MRYFYRMADLVVNKTAIAWVRVGKETIVVQGKDMTVDEAVELRNWLNSVLPL